MQAILVILSILILVVNIAIGALRGVGRSTLRLLLIIGAAFGAYFIAKGLSSSLSGLFVPMLEDFISSNATLAEFVQTNPEMPALVRALAQMLAAPILFLVCYMILKLLTFLLYVLLRKVMRLRGPGKIGSLLGGAGIGLAIGLVGLVIFATPVIGYTDFISRTASALESSTTVAEGGETQATSQLTQYNDSFLKPAANTPVAKQAYSVLGDTLFHNLTSAEWNGQETKLETEWFAIVGMVNEAGKLAEKPVDQYGSEESVAVHNMINRIGESRIMTYLGGNTLNGLSNAWLEGKPFFGIEAPEMGDANAQMMFNGLLRVFSTTTPELFQRDLGFFADMFDLLVKHDMFSLFAEGSGGGNAFAEKMTTSGFLKEAMGLINSNERMAPVTTAITDVGMNILIDQLGLPEEYRETCGELMDDMSDALQGSVTEEGTIDVSQLHTELNEIFADSEVEITESAAEVIANGLSEVFTPEELKTLTSEEIVDRLIDRFATAENLEKLKDKIPEDLPLDQLPVA